MQIRSKPGFDVLTDGSIIARYGVYTNCAGIAQIHFQIDRIENLGIEFELANVENNSMDTSILSGVQVPDYLQKAIRDGVTAGYLAFDRSSGIKFTLISAFVHPIDANELAFKILGKMSVLAWHEHRSIPDKIAWQWGELAKLRSNLFQDEDD